MNFLPKKKGIFWRIRKLALGGAVFLLIFNTFNFALFLKPLTARAAIPEYLTYQGRLKDSSGTALTGTYDFTFKIYDAVSGGNLVWSETQSSISVSSGYFSVSLGASTALDLDFSVPYWITTTVNSDPEMTPRTRVNAVGYAYTASGIETRSSPSDSTSGGRLYYDSDDGNLYLLDGVASSWVDLTAAASGANTDLGNLASTEINADLLPDEDNAISLGSVASSWANLYLDDTATMANASGTNISATDLYVTNINEAGSALTIGGNASGTQLNLSELWGTSNLLTIGDNASGTQLSLSELWGSSGLVTVGDAISINSYASVTGDVSYGTDLWGTNAILTGFASTTGDLSAADLWGTIGNFTNTNYGNASGTDVSLTGQLWGSSGLLTVGDNASGTQLTLSELWGINTDQITEGASNKYWSNTSWDTKFDTEIASTTIDIAGTWTFSGLTTITNASSTQLSLTDLYATNINEAGALLGMGGAASVTGDISTLTTMYAPQICLNGDCQTAWPAGGSATFDDNLWFVDSSKEGFYASTTGEVASFQEIWLGSTASSTADFLFNFDTGNFRFANASGTDLSLTDTYTANLWGSSGLLSIGDNASGTQLSVNELWADTSPLIIGDNASGTQLSGTELWTTDINSTNASSTNLSLTDDLYVTGISNFTGLSTLGNASTTDVSLTGQLWGTSGLLTVGDAISMGSYASTTGDLSYGTDLWGTNAILTGFASATGDVSAAELWGTNSNFTNASGTNLSLTDDAKIVGTFDVTGLTTLGNASTTDVSLTGQLWGTGGLLTIGDNASATQLSATELWSTDLVLSGSASLTGDLSAADLWGTTGNFTNLYGTNAALTGYTSITGDFSAGGTDFWVDDSAGFVGIGRANPGKKLDVYGNASNVVIRALGGTDGSYSATLELGTQTTREWDIAATAYNTNGNSKYDLEIGYVGGDLGGNLLLKSGNIGIATSTPEYLLDIYNGAVVISDPVISVDLANGAGDLYVADNLEVDGTASMTETTFSELWGTSSLLTLNDNASGTQHSLSELWGTSNLLTIGDNASGTQISGTEFWGTNATLTGLASVTGDVSTADLWGTTGNFTNTNYGNASGTDVSLTGQLWGNGGLLTVGDAASITGDLDIGSGDLWVDTSSDAVQIGTTTALYSSDDVLVVYDSANAAIRIGDDTGSVGLGYSSNLFYISVDNTGGSDFTIDENGDILIAKQGHVGIGQDEVASTYEVLRVDETSTDDADFYGVNIAIDRNFTATGNRDDYGLISKVNLDDVAANGNTYNVYGSVGQVVVTDGSDPTNVWGVFGDAQGTQTGTVSLFRGVRGRAINNGAGTVTNLRGVEGYGTNSGYSTSVHGGYFVAQNTNTVADDANYWGVFADVDTDNSTTTNAKALAGLIDTAAGATVGTAYGLYLDLANAGTITTNYGIYLNDIFEGTQTSAYAFWANEGDIILDNDGDGLASSTSGGGDIFLGSGQQAAIWYDGTNLNINPQKAGSGSTSFAAGNVGIATSTPDYLLDIYNGTLAVTDAVISVNLANGAGDLYVADDLEVDGLASGTQISGTELWGTNLVLSGFTSVTGDLSGADLWSTTGNFTNTNYGNASGTDVSLTGQLWGTSGLLTIGDNASGTQLSLSELWGTSNLLSIGDNATGTQLQLDELWGRNGLLTIGTAASITGDLSIDSTDLFADSSSSRVGFGTTTPELSVHIAGNSLLLKRDMADNYLVIDRDDTTYDGELLFRTSGSTKHYVGFEGAVGADTLQIGGTTNGALYITSTGLVGYATATPDDFEIQVKGDIGPDAERTYDLGSSELSWNNAWIRTVQPGDIIFANKFVLTEMPDDNPGMYFKNEKGEFSLTLQGNGNAGFGVEQSDYPLEMKSGAHVTAGGVWTDASDERLKHLVEDSPYGLKEILLLQPKVFKYLINDEPDVGFIAQEVKKLMPELVTGDESERMLGLKYSHLSAVLVKAIQEQQAQIDALTLANSLSGGDLQGVTADDFSNISQLTIDKDMVFNGKITVKEQMAFNKDTVGQAEILPDDTEVRVEFDKKYEYQPIVTLTLRGENALNANFKYTVVDESNTGFTIKISEPQEEPVQFNWHAFGADEGKIFVSDGNTRDIELVIDDEMNNNADVINLVVEDGAGGGGGNQESGIMNQESGVVVEESASDGNELIVENQTEEASNNGLEVVPSAEEQATEIIVAPAEERSAVSESNGDSSAGLAATETGNTDSGSTGESPGGGESSNGSSSESSSGSGSDSSGSGESGGSSESGGGGE